MNWLRPPWALIGAQMSRKASWPTSASAAKRLGGASQSNSAATLATGMMPSRSPVMIIEGFWGGVTPAYAAARAASSMPPEDERSSGDAGARPMKVLICGSFRSWAVAPPPAEWPSAAICPKSMAPS